jgi:cysteine synthase
MKLCPAKYILREARGSGALTRDSVIIESTSGTFGLALAMLAALHGHELILVSDPVIDRTLKRRLEDLGARVEIVRTCSGAGGHQQARLDRMARLQARYPNHFWPSQYHNPHNPGAYARVAESLVSAIGHIDCLVGTVGSGGSMCGTSSFLRLLFPQLHTVGVDTPGSVLFGQPDRRRLLRGLGNSLMPRNLDHTCFDELHWVGAAEAFLATRRLHRAHALYMGPTRGAALVAASWWAAEHPDAVVAVLLPDEGVRYQSTVYDDGWLRRHGVLIDRLPPEPETVSRPADVGPRWSRMRWNRRSYEEVLGGPFQPAK